MRKCPICNFPTSEGKLGKHILVHKRLTDGVNSK